MNNHVLNWIKHFQIEISVHKLRWQVFGFFWPPTSFVYNLYLGKAAIFDYLPTSSCKLSFLTTPYLLVIFVKIFSKMQRSSKHINILFHYKLESCEMTRLQTSEIMRIMINVELCGIYISIFCIDFHYDSLFWINQSASQQCAPPQNLAEISQLHEWTSWNLHLAHTYLLMPRPSIFYL